MLLSHSLQEKSIIYINNNRMKQKLVTKGKAGVSVSPSLDNVRFRLMVFLASVLSLLFVPQAEIIAAGQVQKFNARYGRK